MTNNFSQLTSPDNYFEDFAVGAVYKHCRGRTITLLENVLVTNLDGSEAQQDAERLTFADKSFDVVIVHAGLHHCYSPHRALLEMYRVARKVVVAFESRDSLTMRTAVRLGLTLDYETDSLTADGKGGVAETGIPNFVYRWTERDVIKTIASFDPAREPSAAAPRTAPEAPARGSRQGP